MTNDIAKHQANDTTGAGCLELNEIVLASQSVARQQLLQKHGIVHRAMPTHVDESYWNHEDPQQRALDRAVAKAQCACKMLIEAGHQSGLVIAADQTMAVGDQIFDKAKSRDEARERLQFLQGKTHYLYTAMVFGYAKGDHSAILDTAQDSSRLVMKKLSAAEIDEYLNCGEWVGSVGCMRIEGRGRGLMSEIDGDLSSIQGLNMHQLYERIQHWDQRQPRTPAINTGFQLPLKLSLS